MSEYARLKSIVVCEGKEGEDTVSLVCSDGTTIADIRSWLRCSRSQPLPKEVRLLFAIEHTGNKGGTGGE